MSSIVKPLYQLGVAGTMNNKKKLILKLCGPILAEPILTVGFETLHDA